LVAAIHEAKRQKQQKKHISQLRAKQKKEKFTDCHPRQSAKVLQIKKNKPLPTAT
jgi:hypothetical protein